MKTGKLKFLYFSSQFPTPANPHQGVFSLQRVKALQNAGCNVSVICPVGITPPVHVLKKPSSIFAWVRSQIRIPAKVTFQGITVYYPKWFWPPQGILGWYTCLLLFLQVRSTVLDIITKDRPDVIISSWLPDAITACLYGNNLKVPVISIAEGGDINTIPQKFIGWNFAKKILNRYSYAILFVSESLKAKALSLGIFEQKCKVIHNAVDTNLFVPRNGIKGDKNFSILGVGRLEQVKGFQILLQAYAKLSKTLNNECELFLVGDGRLRNELENQAKELGINEMVRFIGSVDQSQLVSFYQNTDLLCVPSLSESFGCVIIEAMACGKPVVASSVGGIPEIVNSSSGILVPPGNSNLLYRALLKAKDRHWKENIIRQQVEANFTWEKWVTSFLQYIPMED